MYKSAYKACIFFCSIVQCAHGLRLQTAQAGTCTGDAASQGKWVKTDEINPSAHFKTPYVKNCYYYPPSAGKARLMWDWKPESGCSMKYMSKVSFCEMMTAHNLEQVTFAGDSISGQMYLSLLSFLEVTPVPDGSKASGLHSKKWEPTSVDCPGRTIQLRRVQAMSDLTAAKNMDGKNGNWIKEYEQSNNRTLLILNVGAHLHSLAEFTKVWDSFTTTFKTKLASKKSGDKIFFRLTPPGHSECNTYDKPFSSESEFNSKWKSSFDWDLFSQYNDYVRKTVSSEGLDNQVHILDVVQMTKLRPDGHMEYNIHPKEEIMGTTAEFANRQQSNLDVAFEEDLEAALADQIPGIVKGGRVLDCLHYKLPGVPDYWNHMLLQKMMDLQ